MFCQMKQLISFELDFVTFTALILSLGCLYCLVTCDLVR
jgi:hypothetical protein